MNTQPSPAQTEREPRFVPAVDICETKEALWIWADLPGVDEESVEIHLDGGELSIEAGVASSDETGLEPVHTEYEPRSFARRFRLPREIETDGIRARMHQGVLEMELPKSQAARPRRVEIEGA